MFNDVARATVGFPTISPGTWLASPNREGVVSLEGLTVGTHWLLAAGDLTTRRPFLVTIPAREPLLEQRLRSPAWWGKKLEFGQQPVVERDAKEGEVIVVEIHNQSSEALTFSEEDLVLGSRLNEELIRGLSPHWLKAEREPFAKIKIEAGKTGRMRMIWKDWVRGGLWSSRHHEVITEPGFPPDEPGKIWVKAGLASAGSLPVAVTDPKEILATRASSAELSAYRSLSRWRLDAPPIDGEPRGSVSHLDSFVAHLPADVRASAGRRFNDAMRAIDKVPTNDTRLLDRFDAAVDRIIGDTRDLPAAYRAALMCNLMMIAHEWLGREQFEHAGFDAAPFERIKNKCAMEGLAQPDKIPVGLALRLIEFATWSHLTLDTDDDPKWPARRKVKAALRLALMEKIRAAINPRWDPEDRPRLDADSPGPTPETIRDPEERAEYVAKLDAYSRQIERYDQQVQARRLLAELSPRMEEDLVRLYIRKPFNSAELEMLLKQHAADKAQRDRVARSVRLFNAIVSGGTHLKYGWPDGLAESGPAGVPALMAAVVDKTYPKFIRHDGAWALGLIGDPRATDTLIVVAEDDATPAKYKDIAREFVRALKEKAAAGPPPAK